MTNQFIRFKSYPLNVFGIIFTESVKDEDGLILSFDICRAESEFLLDENGKIKDIGYRILESYEQNNENLLLSGFITFPPYENKELLSFSFYGINIEQEEFKELSELLNSNIFLEIFNEKNKLHNSKEGQ